MRSRLSFTARSGSLIDTYTARLAETIAVRRAELEARAARAEAELSIRARSEFLANMNHELRTPLNAILGFSTMLRDSETYLLSDEQRRSYAEYIIQSADLLLGHINTILETAALDSGGVETHSQEADLAEILAGAVNRAAIAAGAAEVAVLNRTKAAEVPCWADALRLGQALDHLLRTALRASSTRSKILVRAQNPEHGWPEIAIRDFGPGLSPEEIRRSLNVFSEVNRGLDRSFAGSGVGLAVAKTFVELQGGRFEINSRQGEGTIVRIMMPPPEAKTHAGSTAPETPLQKAG